MNYVISICSPESMSTLTGICRELELPLSVVLLGEGTASRGMLDILGIESNEKRVLVTVANEKKTKKFIQKHGHHRSNKEHRMRKDREIS